MITKYFKKSNSRGWIYFALQQTLVDNTDSGCNKNKSFIAFYKMILRGAQCNIPN